MNDDRRKYIFKTTIAFFCIYVIWGSTYLAIRIAVRTIPPFFMSAIRCLIAGTLLLGFSAFCGKLRFTMSHLWSTFRISLNLLVIGMGLISWAETRIPSAYAALILGTVPIWVILIEWTRFSSSAPRLITSIGMLICTVGLVWLLFSKLKASPKADFNYFVAVLFACVAWAYGTAQSKHLPLPGNSILSTGLEMTIGGVVLMIISIVIGERLDVGHITSLSLYALTYLILIGSLVAYCAFSWLLKNVSIAAVSTYAFVNPVVAVLLGVFIGHEDIVLVELIGAILIIFGVILVLAFKSACNSTLPIDAISPND